MTIELVLIFLLTGAIVGVLSGLLGIGGGLVLVPFFTAVLGVLHFPPDLIFHYALGTSMACIVITSFFSLRSHQRKQGVLWPYVKSMAIGVVLGAFCTTFVVAKLNSAVLSLIFSVFLVFVAWQMLKAAPQSSVEHVRIHPLELASVAFAIGAISSVVSIGGGSLTVPYLAYRNVDIKKAIGTSAALGFPLSIAGTAGYILNGPIATWHSSIPITVGYVYLPAVMCISVVSVFTVGYGASLAHKLPVATIRRIFACLLVLISIKLLVNHL
jgi:uncharacterized membrane protein YfcA